MTYSPIACGKGCYRQEWVNATRRLVTVLAGSSKALVRDADYTATKTEATLTRGRLSRNAGDTVSRHDCPSPVFRVCVLHEVDDEAELNIGFMACLAPGPNA